MLILHIHRAWFDAIAQGYKTVEYRSATPYWAKRLEGRDYDSVLLHNGYRPSDPQLVMDYSGCEKIEADGAEYYRLQLGKIRQVRNYQLLPRMALPAVADSLDLNAFREPRHFEQFMRKCPDSGYWLPKPLLTAGASSRPAASGMRTDAGCSAVGREVGRIVL